jgi:3-oxoacyl-[acyl-carrier-protein] synthase-3
MKFSHPRLKVIGTGSYLPEQIVRTEDFENVSMWAYDTFGKRVGEPRTFTASKLIELTGIRERRKSRSDEWPSDMGYFAARSALDSANVSADNLDGVVVATVSERDNFPSAAVKIQEKLGARNVKIAYDLQGACAGFPLALMAVNAHARDLPGTWLAVASEALTKINDYTDISSHLFGDGAGAVVLRTQMVDDRGELLAGYSKSEPFNSQSRMIFRDSIANCIRMPDGSAVLKRAVDSMVESAVELKKECNWDRADIYIPHQANERIIAGVEKKLRDDGAIVYRNIAKYGNMSAATCVVALDEAVRDGTIKEGSRVILTSFGAGLVTSAVAIQF